MTGQRAPFLPNEAERCRIRKAPNIISDARSLRGKVELNKILGGRLPEGSLSVRTFSNISGVMVSCVTVRLSSFFESVCPIASSEDTCDRTLPLVLAMAVGTCRKQVAEI